MRLEFTGVIKHVGETLNLTTSDGQPFTKKELLIETVEQYPESVYVTLTGDNAATFFGQVGQTITIAVHFRVRNAGNRMFNEIRVWNYTLK